MTLETSVDNNLELVIEESEDSGGDSMVASLILGEESALKLADFIYGIQV